MIFAATPPKGKNMLAIIMFIMASCATVTKTPFKIEPSSVNLSANTVVQSPVKIDSPKKDTVIIKELEPIVQQLMNDCGGKEDIATLKDLNIRWQMLTLRVLDSARNRKRDKDSLLIAMHGIERKLTTMDTRTEANFKEARDARVQVKDTYNMFETLGTICFVIILLSYAGITIVWLIKRVRKVPVL